MSVTDTGPHTGRGDEASRTAAWVRLVWWPAMVLFTIVAVAALSQSIYFAATGEPVRCLFAAAMGLVVGVPVVREWPNWRAVRLRS